MGGSIDKKNLIGVKFSFEDFYTFCQERYNIFLKKEAGEVRPWTTDPILHNYRFTNLFRSDDATTVFIYSWVKNIVSEDSRLISNLIYARLCNKPSTLTVTGLIDENHSSEAFVKIIDSIGGGKTKAKVNANPVWKGPYQVAGAFKRIGYPYREHLIAYHIPKVVDSLSDAIGKVRSNDLADYLRVMNSIWGYNNNIVFTQVLLDLSDLRPDLVNPTCTVPMSSGVEPLVISSGLEYTTLVRRAMDTWNSKQDRKMLFKDAEHSLCEFRKYLCWKHGVSNPRHYTPTKN
jgi:hypothetical protein